MTHMKRHKEIKRRVSILRRRFKKIGCSDEMLEAMATVQLKLNNDPLDDTRWLKPLDKEEEN